jgi:hypothetical protein
MELPERMFLLAYDTQRKRMTRSADVGLLVRAGALAELELCGALVDENGRATVPRMRRPDVTDPLLIDVLAEVQASARPRRWQHWIQKGRRQTRVAVMRRLVADRIIRAERLRMFGIFPYTRVTVHDARLVRHLHAGVAEALRSRNVDPRDAAMVALAAAGKLRTVFGWRQRRAHRDRIAALTAAGAAAAAKGLKKAVAAQEAAEAAAAG